MVSPHHEPPKIPGFRFRRLIGTGGSSDVFLYEWRQERVNVAVKVWHERLGIETHGAVALETKDVAELVPHPYVLPLHAVGVTSDDRTFVVTDYRGGGDLERRWRREPVPVEEALSLTIKVAGALDVAARHGILHGDVKPANILLTSAGVPQLAGFGSISSAGRASGVESTSLPWTAPEMLDEPPEPSAWADIWSLAATCYTLLAGRTPFEGVSADNATEAVVERIREYDPLAIGRDDVPASLERALRKGMYKRRAGRHWSAADFAKALQTVEKELGLPVTPLADMHEAPSYTADVAPDEAEADEIEAVPEAAASEATVSEVAEPDVSASELPADEAVAEPPEQQVAEPAADPYVEAEAASPQPARRPEATAETKVVSRLEAAGEAAAESAADATPEPSPELGPEPGPEPTPETGAAEASVTEAGKVKTGEWIVQPPPEKTAPTAFKAPGMATYSVAFASDPDPEQEREQDLEPTAATAPRPEVAPEPAAAPAPDPSQSVLPPAENTAEVPVVIDPAPTSSALPVAEGRPVSEDSAWIDHEDDLLGHRADVDRLARLLASPHTQLPVSVAVQGLPGSGRSTFLRTLQERIEWLTAHDGGQRPRARHVRVDARRHGDGDVATRLLESVRREGRNEPPAGVVRLRAAQQRQAELRTALAGLPDDDGHRGKRKPQPLTSTMALEAVDREVAAAEAALRAAPPGPPPGPPAGPTGPAETTIVYVDDLDRCDPATVAGVLQAIDELSTQPGVAVVAAVDARTLQRSIAGRVAEPSAYLAKVFDVPFALRAFVGDPAVRFMRSLMRQAVPSWPSALAAGGAEDRSARRGVVESVEISPGEALFTSELARFCATPRGARKLLTLYRLARSAPVKSATKEPADRSALGILMAILVGAPLQADQVRDAVVEALAAGEDGTTFRKLLETVAREHTVACGRATCGPCADWSRVIRAYTDIARVYQVPQGIGAYADWVDEVARFSFPT
ncbi:serine/threonine protein kinase [Nocardioides albertanoniae]|uniref:Serine/threonine protein kinase n=1 Tax=Nocardioides albertanoniae TaxID=1175486 RepID=A0A543A7F0_9ACTN|nr:serine/threonine-protein kinase [Nocardioides albertanoniae]TQL68525.1 serine/threonine protein kinase [Nocardioides albertanoniae]